MTQSICHFYENEELGDFDYDMLHISILSRVDNQEVDQTTGNLKEEDLPF